MEIMSKKLSGNAAIETVDLEIEDSIKSLVKNVGSKFGKLDILINNAGLTLSADL